MKQDKLITEPSNFDKIMKNTPKSTQKSIKFHVRSL